jgi:hypothetical protein
MSKKQNSPLPTGGDPADTENELIMICARLTGMFHERDVLRQADDWAPDKGPLNPRYSALDKKEDHLRRRLLSLGIPTTREGAIALARVAFLDAERTDKGIIVVGDQFQQLAMTVVQSLAGGNVPMVTEEEHFAARARQREEAAA